MKTFSEFLKSALPKSMDLSDVKGDTYSDSSGLPELSKKDNAFWSTYINELDSWLNGDSANFLLKHKDRVPAKYRKGGTYYRGLSFVSTDFSSLLKILESGKLLPDRTSKISSWTTDLDLAIDFAEKYQMGIVVSAKIASKDVILDVAKWVLDPVIVKLGAAATDDYFSGMTYVYGEGEILVAFSRGGLSVNKKTIKHFYMPTDDYDKDELNIEILIAVIKEEIAVGRAK